MCLADRVLVYGDCAVNPDPDAEQLADIAIQSAVTAARFGVEPRIAMLSYSTGTSGSGADVDKVREATELVRQRRPDLLVEGPIQYDAAVDAVGRGDQAARLRGGRAGHRADLPGPQHRQQHLQGGAALGGRGRRRPGPAGAAQAGQRPLARRAGRRTSSTPSPSPPSRPRASRTGASASERPRTSTRVLVLNSGSSSVKYQLLDMADGSRLASGLVERIGEATSRLRTPRSAAASRGSDVRSPTTRGLRRSPGAGRRRARLDSPELAAVGHRVVHGGTRFTAPTLIDDEVLAEIEQLVPLAPLHNPANITGIKAARRCAPTCRRSRSSTPRSTRRCRRTPPATPSTWRPPTRTGSAATASTAPRTRTCPRATAALLGRDPAEVNVDRAAPGQRRQRLGGARRACAWTPRWG